MWENYQTYRPWIFTLEHNIGIEIKKEKSAYLIVDLSTHYTYFQNIIFIWNIHMYDKFWFMFLYIYERRNIEQIGDTQVLFKN